MLGEMPPPPPLLMFPSTNMKCNSCNPWPLSIFYPLQWEWSISFGETEKKKLGMHASESPYSTLEIRMPADNKCCLAKLSNEAPALLRRSKWSNTFCEWWVNLFNLDVHLTNSLGSQTRLNIIQSSLYQYKSGISSSIYLCLCYFLKVSES